MTRVFDAEGLRLAYDDVGEGEPILLLHGFAADRRRNWRLPGWYDALANAGYRVLAQYGNSVSGLRAIRRAHVTARARLPFRPRTAQSGRTARVSTPGPAPRTRPEPPTFVGIAVRDLARLQSVAFTVGKHGFGPLPMRTPLGRRLFAEAPAGDASLRDAPTPVRFARLLAALGPTYIKLGQILSMRKDLLAPEWIAALETLQDDAPRLSFAAIREQVEASLGGRLEGLYESFAEEPLGCQQASKIDQGSGGYFRFLNR